jgi:DNA-binding CsgD family transcriptional regulator
MASPLSPRQREILRLVASGHTSKEIAAALGISQNTVNWHLANTFARLGASSRAEAVALAMQAAPPPPPAAPPSGWLAGHLGARLVILAITIALAGAVLGGATVAAFRIGLPPAPAVTPRATVLTPSPASTDAKHGTNVPPSVERTSAPSADPATSDPPTAAPNLNGSGALPLPVAPPAVAPSVTVPSASALPAPVLPLPTLPPTLPTPSLPALP